MNFLLSILTQRLCRHPSRGMMRLGFTTKAEGKGVLRTYKLNPVPPCIVCAAPQDTKRFPQRKEQCD